MQLMQTNGHLLPYRRIESGSLVLEFLGHIDAEAYDKDAGEPGACVERADRRDALESTIYEFAEIFYPYVFQLTGIERLVDEKKTARKKSTSPNPERISPILESFSNYTNRISTKVSEEIWSQIKAEALRVSKSLKISSAPKSRDCPVPPAYYRRADSLLSNELSTIRTRVDTYLKLVPNFPITGLPDEKPDRENLARLLQTYEEIRFAMED